MIPGDSASDRGDPYDLNRFISAQEGVYDRALAELRTDRVASCILIFAILSTKRVRSFVMVFVF